MSEPIYTGPLPIQISGNIELGKTYEREGRRLLGKMLAINGVDERIAAGEPGGFYKQHQTMPDGSRLTVTTNNGQHVLRIDSPYTSAKQETRSERHETGGEAPGATLHTTADGGYIPPEVPLPGLAERQVEPEEEEPKRQETSPYMWVGIRYLNSGVRWYTPSAIMIEPDTGPEFADSGLPLRGIISSQDFWSATNLFLSGAGDDWEIGFATYGGDTLDQAVQIMYDGYRDRIDDGNDHAETHIIRGTHAIPVWLNDEGIMAVSGNGLRCESLPMQWDWPFTGEWIGYDPLSDTQFGDGVRSVGDRHTTRNEPLPLWDIVYTLDPDEDEQIDPCDNRPAMQGVRKCLERDFGIQTRVLSGEYILALHSYDHTPEIASRRAGEKIPLYDTKDDEESGLNRRSEHSDYASFMAPVSTTNGLQMEVEVRLGRGDSATTFHFSTTIAESNDDLYANVPYGSDWHSACSPIGGPNPIGPNFAPSFIAIDVNGYNARWIGHDEANLYPILGGGVYSYQNDTRRSLYIYFGFHPFSQPSDETWPEYAGRALWKVMEAATAGVYGNVFISDPGGEEGCKAVFADTSKNYIWRYDAMGGTVEPVPHLGSMDDYQYDWIEDPTYEEGGFWSPYVRELAWYYPYKYIERDACNQSIGVSVWATYDNYTIATGTSVYFDDPPSTSDCC
jgi:hypothetical protein